MEYVLFSGGFDSSAFLLECVFRKKVKVTPIVFIQKDLDGVLNTWLGRQNQNFEKLAREHIYNFVEKYGGEASKLLQPEILVDNLTLSEEIHNSGREAYNKGILRRPFKQVHYFYEFLKNKGIKANVLGTLNDTTTQEIIKYADKEGNVDETKVPNTLLFLTLFKVPYLHLSKQEIFDRAVKYGYSEALFYTWSCFFPSGGKPCGKCEMCQGRIIESRIKIKPSII